MTSLTSYFAPALRQSSDSVKQDHSYVTSIQNLTMILEALPFIVLVLNPERQLIHSNSSLLKMLELPDISSILAKRPGEIINCIHAHENEAGCGTSKHCSVCGAVQAVLESQKTHQRVSREARITTESEGKLVAWDLMVVATPITLGETHYTIVSMADISAEKRKSHLERIFFHDIMNTSAIIQGYADLLRDQVPSHESEIATIISEATNHLVEEIKIQRELLSAESGDLQIKPIEIDPQEILHTAIVQQAGFAANIGCYLKEQNHCKKRKIISDKTLLLRSVTNLVKNAIEASCEGDTVSLSAWIEEDVIFFSVQNPTVMAEEVRLQVFERSFSTKSNSRGWGTYSVKLLVEEYLLGRVSLLSKEDIGTIFTIELPMDVRR